MELRMYRSKSRAIFLLTLFTLAVMATPAYSATITTYYDSTSWLAATTGVTTDDFTGYSPSGTYMMYPTGIFENGVEFIGLSGSTGVMDTTLASYYNFGTGDAGFVSAGGTSVQITLQTPVTAFSIDLFTNPAQVTYTVTTLSTPFTVPTFTTSAGPAFFGVTSDTAFSSVNLQVPTGTVYAFFDNFQFGTADVESPVPEAGTFLLIGTGLLGFAVFRRKVRQPR
jgi:hypothetical protein